MSTTMGCMAAHREVASQHAVSVRCNETASVVLHVLNPLTTNHAQHYKPTFDWTTTVLRLIYYIPGSRCLNTDFTTVQCTSADECNAFICLTHIFDVEMSLNTPARTVGNSLLTAALSVSVPESWFPYRCAKNRPFWRSGLFRLTSGSEWLTAVTWTASRIRIGNLTNHCYLTATEKTTDLQNPAGHQDTIQEKTTYLVTN